MIFYIAFKDLRIIFKDRKALAIMLVMPALIMLILGSALGSSFSSELKISRFSIGVVNRDEGELSRIFINDVLKSEMGEMFDTVIVSSQKADEMLDKKTVPSVIIIPAGFSEGVENNRPVAIEVRSLADDQFKSKIIESVVQGFSQNVSMSYAGANATVDVFKKYDVKMQKPFEGMSDSTAVMAELQKKLGAELVRYTETESEHSRSLSGMQYYSATMLVMFMLFGASHGTKLMVEERENRTLGRIMSTRVSTIKLIAGKFIGLLFICFAQAMILILFTSIFYKVDWGGSIPGILLITLCAVFAGSALGMMIAAISRTTKSAEGFSQLFIQLFTIIGGGMIPIYIMPDTIKFLANFTLNWWAFKGYNSLMMGMDAAAILPYCGILLLMGLGYLTIGVLKFRVE